MARNDEDEVKRIDQLEASIALHRKAIFLVLAFSLVIATAFITYGVVKLTTPDVRYLTAGDLTKIEQHVAVMKEAAVAWQAKADQLQLLLDSSQATAFKTLMLEQEHSFQLHLNALKVGMTDLSSMIPGSRTWLDTYHDQMNEAIAHSKARAAKLARLQTSELPRIDAQDISLPPTPVLINHFE